MSSKSDRQVAEASVREYHQAQLAALVERVCEAVDRFRAGELDPFDLERITFQLTRASQELWKFCNQRDVLFAASVIADGPPQDWWERGVVRERPATR